MSGSEVLADDKCQAPAPAVQVFGEFDQMGYVYQWLEATCQLALGHDGLHMTVHEPLSPAERTFTAGAMVVWS